MTDRCRRRDGIATGIWIGGFAVAMMAGLPTLAVAQSERLPGGIERAPSMPESSAPVARGLRGAPPKPISPPAAMPAPSAPPAAAAPPSPAAPAAQPPAVPKSDKSGAVPKKGPAVAQALDPKDGKAPKPPKTTAPQSTEKRAPGGPIGSGAPRAGAAPGSPPASRGLSGGASERRPGGIERVQGKE